MLEVRGEAPEDAPAVRALLEAAFESPVEAAIVDRLRTTCPERMSLVATETSAVVGHILFTPAVIDTSSGPVSGFGLAPMAVAPARQRAGIGTALVRAGLERLGVLRCPFIVVVGHPEYYPRFGFERASTYAVRCQWEGVPDEAFMILVLDPSVAPRLAGGQARYRPEFDESAE